MPDGEHVESVALAAGKALVVQHLRNAADAHLLIGVEVENPPYYLGLPLIDGQHTVLFVIPPQLVIAQHVAVFDGLPETELQPLGQLAHLVLSHPGHDHQPELAVGVQGVDVVVLEQYPHVVFQQLLSVLDAVQRRTGKAGDLLRDDEVKPPCFCVRYHP